MNTSKDVPSSFFSTIQASPSSLLSSWNRSAYRSPEEFLEYFLQKQEERLAAATAVPSTSISQQSPAPLVERPSDRIDYRDIGGPLLEYLWCKDNKTDQIDEDEDNMNNIKSTLTNITVDQNERSNENSLFTDSGFKNNIGIDKTQSCDSIDACKLDHNTENTENNHDDDNNVKENKYNEDEIGNSTCKKYEDHSYNYHNNDITDKDKDAENSTPVTQATTTATTTKKTKSSRKRISIQKPWTSCSNELSGQTLYLGSAVSEDGRYIYHIPGHAKRVLVIDTETDTCSLMGPNLPGKFKWLRGITIGNSIYGLPCRACTVLHIDVLAQTVSQLPIPYHQFYGGHGHNNDAEREIAFPWKYHGGSVSPIDGKIYCIPQSATHVLQIDPVTNTCHFVGPALPGKYKWYGGTVGKTDGAIYGIPHNSAHVLRIGPTYNSSCNSSDYTTNNNTVHVTLHGNVNQTANIKSIVESDSDAKSLLDASNSGRDHLWHGAAAAANGTIVCVPANADSVLCIYPSGTTATTATSATTATTESTHSSPTIENQHHQQHLQPVDNSVMIVPIGEGCIQHPGRHRTDGKYKYLGAIGNNKNGKVYCFPCAAEHVLEVNPITHQVREIGPNLYDMERICQNKYQNGVYLSQQNIVVAIPLAAESVLTINCNDNHSNEPLVTTWPLPSPYRSLGKFEGATTVTNRITNQEIIYCVPNCHKAVLRIEFPPSDVSTS